MGESTDQVNRKRDKNQILRDRVIIAERMTQGFTQEEIAEELNLKRSTVAYDVKKIKEDWQNKTVLNLEQEKIKQLRKLDLLEKEAWKLFFKSKEDEVTYSEKNTKDYKQKGSAKKGGNDNSKGESSVAKNTQKIIPSQIQQNDKRFTSTQTKKKIGNARVLELVLKIIGERNALLGLPKVTIKNIVQIQGDLERIETMDEHGLNSLIGSLIKGMPTPPENDEGSGVIDISD